MVASARQKNALIFEPAKMSKVACMYDSLKIRKNIFKILVKKIFGKKFYGPKILKKLYFWRFWVENSINQEGV